MKKSFEYAEYAPTRRYFTMTRQRRTRNPRSRRRLERVNHAWGSGKVCGATISRLVATITIVVVAGYLVCIQLQTPRIRNAARISMGDDDILLHHPVKDTRDKVKLRQGTEEGVITISPNVSAPVVERTNNPHGEPREFRTLKRLMDGECGVKDCRVLMTGCGRSGTHFIAEKLMEAGISVLHERIGEAGTVSWVHTAPFREDLAELEVWFSDAGSVELRSSPDFRFFPVFHIVRHPLAAISSLTECFCGCGSMSCGAWADPPSWKMAGKFIEFSNRHCSSMRNGEVCVNHRHGDGRLLRSMEYWLQWNELAGSQAHFRLELETMDLSEVIVAAPQLLGRTIHSEEGDAVRAQLEKASFVRKRARPKSSKSVTWEWMRKANASLEARIWELAQEYGYSRDPSSP